MQSKPENYLPHNSELEKRLNYKWFSYFVFDFLQIFRFKGERRPERNVTERDMKDKYFHDKLNSQNYSIL